MNKALLILAAAVVAHPFISKGLEGFGQYETRGEAMKACTAWAEKIDPIKVTAKNEPYYNNMGIYVRPAFSTDTRYVRVCLPLKNQIQGITKHDLDGEPLEEEVISRRFRF